MIQNVKFHFQICRCASPCSVPPPGIFKFLIAVKKIVSFVYAPIVTALRRPVKGEFLLAGHSASFFPKKPETEGGEPA